MKVIKTAKDFLIAERKDALWYSEILDGDEWINEEYYSTDPSSFCKVGCVFSRNFTSGGNEGICLNCHTHVYWDEDGAEWKRV